MAADIPKVEEVLANSNGTEKINDNIVMQENLQWRRAKLQFTTFMNLPAASNNNQTGLQL